MEAFLLGLSVISGPWPGEPGTLPGELGTLPAGLVDCPGDLGDLRGDLGTRPGVVGTLPADWTSVDWVFSDSASGLGESSDLTEVSALFSSVPKFQMKLT